MSESYAHLYDLNAHGRFDMLSLKDLFFSKILLIKRYVTNVEIVAGVGKQEELEARGESKSLGEVMLQSGLITPKQYDTVVQIQQQTLVGCKSCGLKYQLDELEASDVFVCEACQSEILRLEELASLNLEPLLQTVEGFDSRVIESQTFYLVTHSSIHSPQEKTTTLEVRQDRPSTREDRWQRLVNSTLGHYRLKRKVGEGGSCVVFEGEDLRSHQRVAVKILKFSDESSSQEVERFIREARVTQLVSHPNLVDVLDFGQDENYRYIVLEFVEGETLRDRVYRTGRLSICQALETIWQVSCGLAAAHDQGLVHRDIKPENIMLEKSGAVKLMDFGLAKARAIDAHITQTGQIVGTPYYMSPEQAQASHVDPRSDIYSLGVTLFYALTGTVPFDGKGPIEIILKHLSQTPPPLSDFLEYVPEPLQQLVSKMLSKRPENRHSSAKELCQELDSLPLLEGTCPQGHRQTTSWRKKGQVQWCQKCQLPFVLPPEVGDKKKTLFYYPHWQAFLFAFTAQRMGKLGKNTALWGLRTLFEAERWGVTFPPLKIWKDFGLPKSAFEEVLQEIERQIDIQNPPFLLGQILSKLKGISPTQLLQLLFLQRETHAPLGDLFVQKGLCTHQDIERGLLEQQRLWSDFLDSIFSQFCQESGIHHLPESGKGCLLSRLLQEGTLPSHRAEDWFVQFLHQKWDLLGEKMFSLNL